MVRDGSVPDYVPARSWYELVEDIRQLFLLFGRCNLAESLVAQFAFLVLGES